MWRYLTISSAVFGPVIFTVIDPMGIKVSHNSGYDLEQVNLWARGADLLWDLGLLTFLITLFTLGIQLEATLFTGETPFAG
jgi:hypothetical protein